MNICYLTRKKARECITECVRSGTTHCFTVACILLAETPRRARLRVCNMANRSLALMELQVVGGDRQGITAGIM